MKKSNTLVWHKNKVKLLFFAHHLRGNIHPFTLITLTKPWCLLFWSKISIEKILRNTQKCHFRPISVNWLQHKANFGLLWDSRAPLEIPMGSFDKVNNYFWSYSDLIRGLLLLTLANFGNLVQKLFFSIMGK